MAEHLAALGREVMRDVAQHRLDTAVTLGAQDDGPLLIDMMLKAPITAEGRLTADQLCQLGHGDQAEALADQAIGQRLGVDAESVDDLRHEEEGALVQAHAVDAQRRPQYYADKQRP